MAVIDRQRGRRVDRGSLLVFLERAVAACPPPRGTGEIAVCLVSDRRMRLLNRTFRDRDSATDVLSFPAGEPAQGLPAQSLGDIAIAVPTAARQARLGGHSLGRELKILALHGYLHLLGYDHERDDGTMMRLQRRLERRLLRARKGARS